MDLPVVSQARYDSSDVQNSPNCKVGPAGTGKSTIARTIADTFHHKKRLGAGYFFKRGERDRNDTTRLFLTLVAQFAKTIPYFRSCLEKSLSGLDKNTVEKKGLAIQFEKLL